MTIMISTAAELLAVRETQRRQQSEWLQQQVYRGITARMQERAQWEKFVADYERSRQSKPRFRVRRGPRDDELLEEITFVWRWLQLLARENITTVGQVRRMTDRELRKIYGLGSAGLQQIRWHTRAWICEPISNAE